MSCMPSAQGGVPIIAASLPGPGHGRCQTHCAGLNCVLGCPHRHPFLEARRHGLSMSPSASLVGLRSGQDRRGAPALQQDSGPKCAPDPAVLSAAENRSASYQRHQNTEAFCLWQFQEMLLDGDKCSSVTKHGAESYHLAQVRAQGTCASVSLLIGHF